MSAISYRNSRTCFNCHLMQMIFSKICIYIYCVFVATTWYRNNFTCNSSKTMVMLLFSWSRNSSTSYKFLNMALAFTFFVVFLIIFLSSPFFLSLSLSLSGKRSSGKIHFERFSFDIACITSSSTYY